MLSLRSGVSIVTGRRLGVVGVALFLASTVAGMQSGRVNAGSASWTYPTDCATVQACIDSASATPGATVYMAADAVGQVASISTSLSLKSINATRYKIDIVGIVDTSTPVFATVAGLDIKLILSARIGNASGSSVNLRNNIVGGLAGQTATIFLTAAGTASFNVENNTAHIVGDSDALSVFTQMTSGTATFNLVGNRLDGHGSTTSGSGIDMSFEDSGQVVGNVYNNSIWDVGRVHAGAAAGISIVPRDTVKADLNVVGNTVERSDTDGLQQRNDLTGAGKLTLDMFNNTFSHAKSSGVSLEAGSPGTIAFRAGFNNYFSNAFGNQPRRVVARKRQPERQSEVRESRSRRPAGSRRPPA